MLTLTRTPAVDRTGRPRPVNRGKPDDALIVILLEDGRELRFTVHSVNRRGEVRVAIEAPRTIEIERGEVYRETRNADPHGRDHAREWEAWAARQAGGAS